MKKIIIGGLVCFSLCAPLQVSAQSLVERVVTDVILGVYDRPHYYDDRPYYFYNNRYYYGGEWRNGYYFYKGKRFKGGHYYKRGYYEHYKKPKHPNHKNGYYKHNKHYLGDPYGDKHPNNTKKYKKGKGNKK